MKNVSTREEAVSMLLTAANPANINKESPAKQPVISRVCLNVMAVAGSGLKKEKGHQIKSLSDNQLCPSGIILKIFVRIFILVSPSNFQRSSF